MEFKEKN